jgi:hypothetical protein
LENIAYLLGLLKSQTKKEEKARGLSETARTSAHPRTKEEL